MSGPLNIFGDILGDVTKLLPPEVATAINSTVGVILDPGNPSINPGDPQPAGPPPIPVAAGSPELDAAQKAIETVVGVLNEVLTLASWAIPEPYETYVRDVVAALSTVESWL